MSAGLVLQLKLKAAGLAQAVDRGRFDDRHLGVFYVGELAPRSGGDGIGLLGGSRAFRPGGEYRDDRRKVGCIGPLDEADAVERQDGGFLEWRREERAGGM